MKIGIISDTHDNLPAIENAVKIFNRIAIVHGKDEQIVVAMAKSGQYDVVIRGHTHRQDIGEMGLTRIINPGDACGYLKNKRTVAILDIGSMKVEIIEM